MKVAKTRDGSVANDHWRTPPELYKKLDAEFGFDFDPCPLHADFDGLVAPWGKCNFVNPPYNKVDKPKFIAKARAEQLLGKTSVMLIPAATSTKQFHEVILPNAEVRFFKGRIKFVSPLSKGAGKHDSMLVIFRGIK
jgi:DNA N-6-adenine-methyltransferase (Dam)